MSRPTKGTMDCATGIETFVELTDEEMAEIEANAKRYAEEMAKAKEELERVAALKESAKAKLIAGKPLTEEEAATIVL